MTCNNLPVRGERKFGQLRGVFFKRASEGIVLFVRDASGAGREDRLAYPVLANGTLSNSGAFNIDPDETVQLFDCRDLGIEPGVPEIV